MLGDQNGVVLLDVGTCTSLILLVVHGCLGHMIAITIMSSGRIVVRLGTLLQPEGVTR